MSKAVEYIRALDRAFKENPMIEEHYPLLSVMLRDFKSGAIELIVSEPDPRSCSSCFALIAVNGTGRKLNWPNYCPNCGKRRQDVGGTCARPVYA